MADPVFFVTARKRSLGQSNIFSSVCQEFCPGGWGLPQCILGYHPPLGPGRHPPRTGHAPPWQADLPTPDQAGTPLGPGRTPRHYEIRSMSGRYASYWNAILFVYVCKWVAGRKPPLERRLAQVVNSNSTSVGQETLISLTEYFTSRHPFSSNIAFASPLFYVNGVTNLSHGSPLPVQDQIDRKSRSSSSHVHAHCHCSVLGSPPPLHLKSVLCCLWAKRFACHLTCTDFCAQ